MTDDEMKAYTKNRELHVTYQDKAWHLTAYPLEDFGTWEVAVQEQGTDTPALSAAEWCVPGLYRDPWTALSIQVDAIIRRVGKERAL